MTISTGYNTYIAAVAVLVCTLIEKFGGIDIPGFAPQDNWLSYVLGAFGLVGLRAAIAKIGIGIALPEPAKTGAPANPPIPPRNR